MSEVFYVRFVHNCVAYTDLHKIMSDIRKCAPFQFFSFYFSFSAENEFNFYFSFIFRPKNKIPHSVVLFFGRKKNHFQSTSNEKGYNIQDAGDDNEEDVERFDDTFWLWSAYWILVEQQTTGQASWIHCGMLNGKLVPLAVKQNNTYCTTPCLRNVVESHAVYRLKFTDVTVVNVCPPNTQFVWKEKKKRLGDVTSHTFAQTTHVVLPPPKLSCGVGSRT